MCFKRFTAAVMSVQLCNKIQNPGQKCFKLNHVSFVNLLKITETWIIQRIQENFTMPNCFSKRMKLSIYFVNY